MKGNNMITPDTIITVEILAGLDKCPFCQAGTLHTTRTELTLECGTYLRVGRRAEKDRGLGCYEQDNETLRARVKELEEALSLVVPACEHLHHFKKHRHQFHEHCPVEDIIRKAKGTK